MLTPFRLGLVPLVLHAFPGAIIAGCLGEIGASLVFFASSVVEPASSISTLNAAIVTSVVSAISIVTGTVVSLAKLKLDSAKMLVEASERDHERKHQAEQAELERKERMYDFRNELATLHLRIEEKNLRLKTLESELSITKTVSQEQSMRINQNHQAIQEVKKTAEDSGQFKPTPAAVIPPKRIIP